MKDKKEIAKLIYEELKKGNIESTLNTIFKELENEKTDKLKFTKTPLLNSIGQELAKLLVNEDWKFKTLMDLWKTSQYGIEDIDYRLKSRREVRRIIIVCLGSLSKRYYEDVKKFITLIVSDLQDWETVDSLALFVISNLAVQNQKELFYLMEQWIKSKDKWVRRLAVATIPPYIMARSKESEICLGFLKKVMKEGHKDVKKAIGWALREITKKDSNAVFEFLLRWAKVEDKNTRWIVKEGMKKLPEEQQKLLRSLIGG